MMEGALALFTFLAGILVLEAAHSLKGGVEFYRFFRRSRGAVPGAFTPPAVLMLPCKGLDPGLMHNLEAYFGLDYPDYRIILATGEPSDPCVDVFRKIAARYASVRSDIIFAGRTSGRGQKVHNLLQALRQLDARDRVLVFGDSDIRPMPSWLRHLVAGLDDARVGASTGFRWYIPQRGNFASLLRSVWNAGAATLFGERKSPFAWGGAMAIRRDTFEACAIGERWHSALSDDYAVTRAMAEHGLRIQFVPQALSFTREDCGLRELLDWSFRQLAITRVYKPSLWRLALASESFSNLTFWGGVTLAVVGLVRPAGPPALQAALPILLLASYILRGIKGWLRTRAIRVLFPDAWNELRRHWHAFVFWGPLSSLVMLVGLLRSAVNREIEWRGVRYRLVSPEETIVLS